MKKWVLLSFLLFFNLLIFGEPEWCECYSYGDNCDACLDSLDWYKLPFHGHRDYNTKKPYTLPPPQAEDYPCCGPFCDLSKCMITFKNYMYRSMQEYDVLIFNSELAKLGLCGWSVYSLATITEVLGAFGRANNLSALTSYHEFMLRMEQFTKMALDRLLESSRSHSSEASSRQQNLEKDRKKLSPEEIKEREDYIAKLRGFVDESQEGYLKVSTLSNETHAKLNALFTRIHSYCALHHSSLSSQYEWGLQLFMQGKIEDFLDIVRSLLENASPEEIQELMKNISLTMGEALVEVGLYEEAIQTLSGLIAKDPSQKEAFFQRAQAYFQTGEFDLALEDYLSSGFQPQSIKRDEWDFKEYLAFQVGWAKGGARGTRDGFTEFFPTLLSCGYGIGHGLWAVATDPVRVSKDLKDYCCAYMEALKELDLSEAYAFMVKELRDAIDGWNTLSPAEQGERMGYIVGKCGIEILCGETSFKALLALKNLKRAQLLETFERMRFSSKAKAEIIDQATLFQAHSKPPFTFIIDEGRQNKHTLGHPNYNALLKENESLAIMDHPNPQELVNQFAGTGIRCRGKLVGEAGYQEIVDFKMEIGYWAPEHEAIHHRTTRGKIHYAEGGKCHIVPTRPHHIPPPPPKN